MIEDPADTDPVTRAATGDQRAWDALVDRYAPLLWYICRQHRLSDADARTVGQAVWPQLTSQLGNLREPAALAGWLATTTRRECGKVRHAARELHADGPTPDTETTGMAEHQLRATERDATLHEAFTRLPPCCQQLITMLTEDPPAPYAQISATLGIPVGRISSSRRRCLNKLRQDPALAALINPGAALPAGEL